MSVDGIVSTIANNLLEKDEDTLDFQEYKGLTFEDFWNALPRKLEFTNYERELAEILEKDKKLWVKKDTGVGIS